LQKWFNFHDNKFRMFDDHRRPVELTNIFASRMDVFFTLTVRGLLPKSYGSSQTKRCFHGSSTWTRRLPHSCTRPNMGFIFRGATLLFWTRVIFEEQSLGSARSSSCVCIPGSPARPAETHADCQCIGHGDS
jgi:hypothetical protein